ncbi:MAG: hypothetical protein Q8P84_04630 [Deltaproteobacteria bacterium]|nr:hypothetical protein [Deltaproteobacteria bacterium]
MTHPTVVNATMLVQNLQTALQSDTTLAPLADNIFAASEGTFAPETLEKLCDRIGSIHPGLGCRLLIPVAKARVARDPLEISKAWREFTEVLTAPEKRQEGLVAFATLKKISMILIGKQRKVWLMEGLKQLAIPHADSLLKDPVLRLDERRKFFLKISRGENDFFTLHTPHDLSDSTQMTLHIEVPQNWKKPLDEKTLQLLIARTLTMTILSYLAGVGVAQGYQKIAPVSLDVPIPLVVAARDGWVQFGPPALPKRVEQDWREIHRWIIDGSLLFTDYQASRHMAMRAQTAAHLRAGGRNLDLGNITPFWIELLQMPNAPELLSKMLGNIIPSQPLFFRTVIEINAETKPGTIKAVLENEHYGLRLLLFMQEATLKTLQDEEILELIWRVMKPAQANAQEQKRRKRNPFRGVEYKTEDLKELEEQPAAEKLGGSLLKLLFAGTRFLERNSQGTDFELTGLSGMEKKSFMSALAERHKIAPGGKSATHKKWIVREAGMEDRGGVMEIIPMERVILIHIHGDAKEFSKQDWLFLMQTLDAHDAAMLKISLESREILSGSR